MRKSERIHDMMIYLNDKNRFNLKHLMDRYHISRSTALRDIQSLEEIGMPIYSQPGRHGYYGILQNRILSPIIFNMDEMYALYFAMLTLKAYASTPFHLSIEKLQHKFELCLSNKQLKNINIMEKVIKLGPSRHPNSSPMLKDVLQAAIEEKVCLIHYMKSDSKQPYVVQFFEISTAYSQWYVTAFNYITQKIQVFRCDKIESISISKKYHPHTNDELKTLSKKRYHTEDAIAFEVEINSKGIDYFYKEHYPSMKLLNRNGQHVIQGFYHPSETDFIAQYFMAYNQTILSIQPASLKDIILEKLHALQSFYQNL